MSVPVTLGRLAGGGDLVLDLSDSWHTALQGMSRSGKSVLTYTLLASLAHRPDVVVCGVDPTGILLNCWSSHPGEQFRATSSNVQGWVDALQAVVSEMDRRIRWLMENDYDKVGVYSPAMPLLVIVMEEYPGALSAAESDDQAEARKPAERLAPQIQRCVRRIVQEGAKAGLRLVLIAQRMDASIVGGAERSNLGNRITMRVDNRDAVTMLHPTASSEWVEQATKSQPGVGLIDRPGEETDRFKADFLDYRVYVQHVRSQAPHGVAPLSGL